MPSATESYVEEGIVPVSPEERMSAIKAWINNTDKATKLLPPRLTRSGFRALESAAMSSVEGSSSPSFTDSLSRSASNANISSVPSDVHSAAGFASKRFEEAVEQRVQQIMGARGEELARQYQQAEERIRYLESKLQMAEALRVSAEDRCAFIYHQIGKLQDQHAKVTGKKSRRTTTLNTGGEILMPDEFLDKLTARRAEEQERSAQAQAKVQETSERLQREERIKNSTTKIFNSGWKAANKATLQDLAYALALPIDGKREKLVKSILKKFEEEPGLKQDFRFAGMFTKKVASRSRKPPCHSTSRPTSLSNRRSINCPS